MKTPIGHITYLNYKSMQMLIKTLISSKMVHNKMETLINNSKCQLMVPSNKMELKYKQRQRLCKLPLNQKKMSIRDN
jgi:hypothetical protein